MNTRFRPKPRVFVAVPPARGRRLLLWSGVVAGLFALGYLLAVFVLFPPLPVPQDGIAVPDLTGKSIAAAQEELRPLGLTVGDTVSFPHNQIGAGLVIAQSPLAGQQLRSGGRVNLGLSDGLAAVTVPDVAGQPSARASTLLQRLGFQVSEVLEPSEQANGTVIRTAPAAGSRQSLPAQVQLFVSAGLPQDTTTVIDTLIRRDTIH